MIQKKRATSVRVGDLLDTDAGPAKVIAIEHDPYNGSSRGFRLDVPGFKSQPTVGYLGGQLVPVVID